MSNAKNLRVIGLLSLLQAILLTTPVTASDKHIREIPLGKAISKTTLMAYLERADVVILGEIHDDPACHSIQTEIIRKLTSAGQSPALYFEMLTDREEVAYENFLRTWAGDPGDSSVTKDAARREILTWEKRGWPVWDAYAPIFRLADQNGLPVRHGDPSPELMRNIKRFGLLAIPKQMRIRLFDGFKEGEIGELSDRLSQAIADAHQGQSNPSGYAGLIQAQMTRDAYMALRLSQAEHPAVLIAGVEHARKDHGVPFHLGRRVPHLNVISIALCGALPPDQASTDRTAPFDFYWAADSTEWRRLDYDDGLPASKE